MTDIVERLRSVDISWSQEAEWCAEAASEIEQLRKDNAEIKRLREALRLARDRVEPLASFQQKDIGSSTIRVGEETKFSRDARSFNGEK